MDRKKEACHCKNISYGMIEDAIRSGISEYDELQERLHFGTSCGKCREFIQYLVRDIKEEMEKAP